MLRNEKMKGKGVLLWGLFILVLGGCSDFRTVGRQELSGDQVALSAEQVSLYREVANASPVIESLDGYADVWIKTPKRQNRVFCNIRINRGHEARLIVSAGVLGWPVADMFFSTDSLFVHDMLNNRLFLGSNNDLNLEKVIGVNSGFRLLSESLLGLVNITEPLSAIRQVKQGSGTIIFTLSTRWGGTKEVVINPSSRTLAALFVKNRQGIATTEIHFKNYETILINGHSTLVPKEIEMVLYNSGADGIGEHQLVIAYDERIFNKRGNSLKFSMPKKAKIVNLDDAAALPWM